MKFSLKILESHDEIRKTILNTIMSEMDIVLKKSLPSISDKIKDLAKKSLMQEPEYSSLVSGKLKAEFGIPDSNKVDMVVDGLVNTLKIESNQLKINRNGISGGFTLTMIGSSDMSGIIFTDMASVMDDKGYYLPWLEWLLLRGNQIIVRNYSVNMGPNPNSRSGMAIMIPSSSNWRVPPEYAGTIQNNWTTRAIDRIEPEVYNTIISTIESNI
jgi:hypothetical protein